MNQFKKIALVVLIVAALSTVLYFLFSYGFIEVAAPQQENQSITLTVAHNNTTTTVEVQGTYKKLVKRGHYRVEANSGTSSGSANTQVGGFLTTTRVELPSLTPENDRNFFGNDPSSCVFEHQNALYSYECEGTLASLRIHLPATADSPTTTEYLPTEYDDVIEGVSISDATARLLVKSSLYREDEDPFHAVLTINPDRTYTYAPLPDLNPFLTYRVTTTTNGNGVIYSSEDTALYTYDAGFINIKKSIAQLPEGVVYADERNGTTLLYSGDAYPTDYEGFYQRISGDFVPSNTIGEAALIGSDSNQGVVRKNSLLFVRASETVTMPEQINTSKVFFCGNESVCSFSDAKVKVERLVNGNLDKTGVVYDEVADVYRVDEEIILVKNNALWKISPETGVGYKIFTFRSLDDYCGVKLQNSTTLLLCTSSNSQYFTLRIDISTPDSTNGVSTKILTLADNPIVSAVSPYANILYITPDAGEVELNPVTGVWDYNTEVRTAANLKVRQLLSDLQIDLDTIDYRNVLEY